MWKCWIVSACIALLSACGGGGGGGGGGTAVNQAPSAQPGPDRSGTVGQAVTLDGSASTDPEGQALTYQWALSSRPAGSTAVLTNPTAASAGLVPDLPGTYVATLIVSDGQLGSAPKAVTLTVVAANAAPAANAGASQNVLTGASVVLDGTASQDPEGDPLTYAWSLTTRPAGSAAVVANAGSARAGFVADVSGNYVATLVVSDGRLSSAPSSVTITATTGNAAPVANAGPNQSVFTGATVSLDGRGSSDANGDALTYAWSITARPAGSSAALSNASAAAPSFVADLAGDYAVRLVVNDGRVDSAAATVTVSAKASHAPPGYTLAWADEFDVDGLPDPARWDYDTDRNATGWYNGELQYYARDRAENARVSGGRLIVTARKEALSANADWGGQQYSSARLVTRGKASWTYGFIEVRAKLPCGAGTWPAIWTLGTRGTWPDDGEIDIMEQVGSNPTRIFGTLHTLQSGAVGTGGETIVADACTAFHDYQLTWTPDTMLIGVDNVNYYSFANPRSGYAVWPFDFPQYLLLNIAIGGTLGGAVDDAIFPVTLEVEHVRVFQKP